MDIRAQAEGAASPRPPSGSSFRLAASAVVSETGFNKMCRDVKVEYERKLDASRHDHRLPTLLMGQGKLPNSRSQSKDSFTVLKSPSTSSQAEVGVYSLGACQLQSSRPARCSSLEPQREQCRWTRATDQLLSVEADRAEKFGDCLSTGSITPIADFADLDESLMAAEIDDDQSEIFGGRSTFQSSMRNSMNSMKSDNGTLPRPSFQRSSFEVFGDSCTPRDSYRDDARDSFSVRGSFILSGAQGSLTPRVGMFSRGSSRSNESPRGTSHENQLTSEPGSSCENGCKRSSYGSSCSTIFPDAGATMYSSEGTCSRPTDRSSAVLRSEGTVDYRTDRQSNARNSWSRGNNQAERTSMHYNVLEQESDVNFGRCPAPKAALENERIPGQIPKMNFHCRRLSGAPAQSRAQDFDSRTFLPEAAGSGCRLARAMRSMSSLTFDPSKPAKSEEDLPLQCDLRLGAATNGAMKDGKPEKESNPGSDQQFHDAAVPRPPASEPRSPVKPAGSPPRKRPGSAARCHPKMMSADTFRDPHHGEEKRLSESKTTVDALGDSKECGNDIKRTNFVNASSIFSAKMVSVPSVASETKTQAQGDGYQEIDGTRGFAKTHTGPKDEDKGVHTKFDTCESCDSNSKTVSTTIDSLPSEPSEPRSKTITLDSFPNEPPSKTITLDSFPGEPRSKTITLDSLPGESRSKTITLDSLDYSYSRSSKFNSNNTLETLDSSNGRSSHCSRSENEVDLCE